MFKVYELLYVIKPKIITQYYRVYLRDLPVTTHMKRFFNSPFYYKYTLYGDDGNEHYIKIQTEIADLRNLNPSYIPAFRLTISKHLNLQRN